MLWWLREVSDPVHLKFYLLYIFFQAMAPVSAVLLMHMPAEVIGYLSCN